MMYGEMKMGTVEIHPYSVTSTLQVKSPKWQPKEDYYFVPDHASERLLENSLFNT